MSSINLFKINDSKLNKFITEIRNKRSDEIDKKVKSNYYNKECGFKLFLDNGGNSKETDWAWIGDSFNIPINQKTSNPRGWLIVKTSEKNIYCATFGIAYHSPDKYCDSEFPFELLKRLNVKDVKNTTRTNPTSNRRRVIDSFVSSDVIDFDAGDSIQKVKFSIDRNALNKTFNSYFPIGENIEIGSSLKFTPKFKTLESVLDCILAIEKIISELPKITDVPHLITVRDAEEISLLNSNLENASFEDINLALPDFRVIGTKIWDASDLISIELKYKNKSKEYNELTILNLKDFQKELKIDFKELIKYCKVILKNDIGSSSPKDLKDLIEYVNEESRTVLINGKWNKFNEDYIRYVNDEIKETRIIRMEKYDYLNRTLGEPKRIDEGRFNQYVSDDAGFVLLDKVLKTNELGKFEVCDLFDPGNGSMIAVKNVKDSKSLCYVIDQSEMATRTLKANGTIDFEKTGQSIEWKNVNESAIWIILTKDEQHQLEEDIDGRPMIENLGYFLAKMKIPTWKRTIRNLNRVPTIYLSYR